METKLSVEAVSYTQGYLTVDEPIPEAELQQEEEREKMSTGTIVLTVLCVLLTAGLVVQGMLLTRKIHKLEEDRL